MGMNSDTCWVPKEERTEEPLKVLDDRSGTPPPQISGETAWLALTLQQGLKRGNLLKLDDVGVVVDVA